jgi:hypothetical protein
MIDRNVHGQRGDQRPGHQDQCRTREKIGPGLSTAKKQHAEHESGQKRRISTLIGPPRLVIIKRPTSRNVPGVIAAIDRLRLNHVPQNTPVTRENTSSVTN